jgi:nucleotide-binding universal stress UspA family protein
MENTYVPDTILVALDGSPSAQVAAKVAIQVAQRQNLRIRGLYVVDDMLIFDIYTNHRVELGNDREITPESDLVQSFREQGDAALQWLEQCCLAANVPVVTDLYFSNVPEMIRREAEPARLVALGRRGHGHATDPNHLGRYFRAIAHHAKWPLLVGGDELRPLRRLLLAYDGGECAQRALNWTVLLQRALATDVIAVAVEENDHGSPQWLSDLQRQLDTSELANYRFVSRKGHVATEIVSAAEEYQADLILMGNYCISSLLEWLVGSTPDHVLRQTQLPVLIA